MGDDKTQIDPFSCAIFYSVSHPPFVGWMFFCSLLFRILSRTRVDNISERDSTEHAHDYYPGFLKGGRVHPVPEHPGYGAVQQRGEDTPPDDTAGHHAAHAHPVAGDELHFLLEVIFLHLVIPDSQFQVHPADIQQARISGDTHYPADMPSAGKAQGKRDAPVLHYPFREDFHFKALHTDQGSSDGFPVSGSMPGANIFIRLPSSSFITSMLSWTESTPWEFTPPPKSLPVTFAL